MRENETTNLCFSPTPTTRRHEAIQRSTIHDASRVQEKKEARYSLNARVLTTNALVAGAVDKSSWPASQYNAVALLSRSSLLVAGCAHRRLQFSYAHRCRAAVHCSHFQSRRQIITPAANQQFSQNADRVWVLSLFALRASFFS